MQKTNVFSTSRKPPQLFTTVKYLGIRSGGLSREYYSILQCLRQTSDVLSSRRSHQSRMKFSSHSLLSDIGWNDVQSVASVPDFDTKFERERELNRGLRVPSGHLRIG